MKFAKWTELLQNKHLIVLAIQVVCVCVCGCVLAMFATCLSICVTDSETCRGQWRHVFQSAGTEHSKPWALENKLRMAALVSHL
jgi:hypothetical protein